MNRRQLFRRISRGDLQNVHFSDFVNLLEGFGFTLMRRSGSHRIYIHPDLNELLNIQEVAGDAKPYQVRQFLRLVERYNLQLRD